MENETKQNWLKANAKVCIIGVVAVLAIVAVVVVLMMNQKDSPEKVIESYISAMQNGDVDAMMEIMDLKGAVAWESCGKDPEKFMEEYNKISDDDVKAYESEFRSTMESSMQMLQNFGGLELSINKIETPEKLANDLYAVTANVKMKVTVLGMEQNQEEDMSIAVYNGKYIGEYSK